MQKQIRALINLANAQKSTGPRSPAGKQRSRMNACKHNLTGNSVILQDDEMDAYNRLTSALLHDLQPRTELERQTVQKIVDTHFRLNRLAGVENNIFNFALVDYSTDSPNDDRVEVLIAQTRAWIERSSAFDVLGRYENRLARLLLRFTLELERLQRARRAAREPAETAELNFELASFCRNTPDADAISQSYRVLTQLPAPRPPEQPDAAPIANQGMQA